MPLTKMAKKTASFTIVELIVIMGVVATLLSFVVVNLFKVQHRSKINAAVPTLISDLKQQQTKAMVGDGEGETSSAAYGIYFESTSYTLFRGSTFDPTNSSNFTIDLEQPVRFISLTFPNSTLVFSKGSGAVVGFVDGANSLILKDVESGEEVQITVNRLGVISDIL